MHVGDEHRTFQYWAWDGHFYSPNTFSIYSGTIIRSPEGFICVKVEEHNIISLRYADNQVFIAENLPRWININ